MELIITTDIVVAYSQCPRKAYLLLFSPDKGEPHEYIQILEQQRCENQKRYLDRLQHTHADVHPYALENLRKGSKVLINVHLQVDGFAANCGVLTRVKGGINIRETQLRTLDLRGYTQHQQRAATGAILCRVCSGAPPAQVACYGKNHWDGRDITYRQTGSSLQSPQTAS
jgi:hypothetical protein